MVKGIFHLNVNVTDFERSLEFYKRLGFKVVRDLGEGGNKYLERGLGFQRPVSRAALLMIGEDKHATGNLVLCLGKSWKLLFLCR